MTAPSTSFPTCGRSQTSALLCIVAITALGYAATLLALYPGYLTIDATFVYRFMREWSFRDWQSPLMSVLWAFIDPVAPGPGSMFLLIASTYWLAFALLALAIMRQSARLAVIVPVLGFVPPAFLMLCMIWRDILFAVVWLLAATIVYVGTGERSVWRRLAQALSLALIGFGVLIRPNAALAAALLVVYALWPTRFSWKRAAAAFVPAAAASIVLVHVVYYQFLGAAREHPEQSLMVFDLGGITRFVGENQFPVTWTPQQAKLLTTGCYDPARWDTYWTIAPCDFVMKRLEDPSDPLFGTSRLTHAWANAVGSHPLAYLRHRLTFFWQFLWDDNVTLERDGVDDPTKTPLARNPYFKALLAWHDALVITPLFRTGLWLMLAAATCLFAWPWRNTRGAAFAIGICASGVVYVMTFLLIGVAGDFRYGYWCVLATLAGGAAALTARPA